MDSQQELNEAEDMIFSLRKEIDRLQKNDQSFANHFCGMIREIESLKNQLTAEQPTTASDGYAVRIIRVESCRGECPYECEQTNICSLTCKQIGDPKTIPKWCPLDKT